MKTEDFERLKKLCDENGFELVTESPKENDKFFVVKKRGEWEGVEFYSDHLGVVRKMTDDVLKVIRGGVKLLLHPSTEQAYVEQLKKEAHRRFGEIKNGTSIKSLTGRIVSNWFDQNIFSYQRNSDSFYFQDCLIYQQGKWAERVKERVEIKFIRHDYDGGDYFSEKFSLEFRSKNLGERNYEKMGNFLAKQLEKYLNGEIE